MTIARLKSAAIGLACLAAGVSAQAGSSTLISEDFASVPALAGSGWVITNESTAGGAIAEGWFQGDQTTFGAQSGAADSFAASNYNTAAAGGSISNWLITPTFATDKPTEVSFYARADIIAPYFDQIAYGFSTSASSSTGSFIVGSTTTVGGSWALYTAHLAAQGAGSVARFAVQYTGAADSANYIGVDTLTVTAVPEPSAWLMFGAGLLGLAAARTRGRRA